MSLIDIQIAVHQNFKSIHITTIFNFVENIYAVKPVLKKRCRRYGQLIYIYKYPELAYKIQCLREQQKYSLVANNQSAKKNEILQIKNTKLKQEIAELKVIIEQGQRGGNKLEDLQVENIQLAKENLRLKKELKHTLQNLQEARAFILEQRLLNQEQQ